ncbi:MAG: DNA gyrase subunit A [Ruminococcaceae bacterium]|nr:DNA gyrase subunit A [Oscillospiraceae bacterium]
MEDYPNSTLIVRDIEKEMKDSFLDYSMSVIVARALPDVRDGLKPVHRRILYTMHERGNDPSHPFKKSADTVGSVLGSYHPHGDASVYDAMVRLAQDFSMRYPLVEGQGNFGSVDGDPPAAYRYTEARMSRMAVSMMTDIDKETIDFVPNFDESKVEPSVLPARYPNLLCNGSTGIAVGMATNIPPHNLSEVIDGAVAVIDSPDIDLPGLMEHITGPDFPTGGIIMGRSGIRSAYATGRGKIVLRGLAEIEEQKNGRFLILITELPYMVNKAKLLQDIDRLVKEKRIEGITDINDESNRKGMRVVIEVRRDANPQVVLNQLYHLTQLQDSIGVIMLALDDGQPKVMDLKTMLVRYVDFQAEVIRRRTEYDLKRARDRAHILDGLRRAIDIVDEVIATIRGTKGASAEAKKAIMDTFGFDDPQATAIVAFRLGQLAGLEIEKIENEYRELMAKIAGWETILASEERVRALVKEELLAFKDKYGDDRRTDIAAVSGEVDIEDLIPEEECVFTLTHAGYIKRMATSEYQSQKRGGRGVTGLSHKEEDFVEELFVASSHDHILFITDIGRAFRLKGYQVATGSRAAKGTNIVNLLQLQTDEKVTNMLRVPKDREDGFVTMVTKNGLIKRSPLSAYRNIRKSGLIAIRLDDGDALAWTRITSGQTELLVATHGGRAIRIQESDARPLGRNSRGVRAIRMEADDWVVGVSAVREGATLMTVSEAGKGRRTAVEEYRVQRRGGKGILNYRGGGVAAVKVLQENDDILLISLEGIIIRMHACDINVQSRYGSGVRVMRLAEGDRVVMMARAERDDEAETALPDAPEAEEALSPEELARLEAEDAAAQADPGAADDDDTDTDDVEA